MATIAEQLIQLQNDKQVLVDNLVAKGVEASSDETFTTLAPKVADIEAGGGDVFLDDVNEIPTTANFAITDGYVTNEGIYIGGTGSGQQNVIIDLNTKEVINNNNNSMYLKTDPSLARILETDDYVFFTQNSSGGKPFGVFIKATNELKVSYTGTQSSSGGCAFYETSDGEIYGVRGTSKPIMKFNFETEMFEDLQTISNSSNFSYIKFIELSDKSLILVFTYTNQCIYKKAPNETQFQKLEIDGFTDATALRYCWQYEDGLVCHNDKNSSTAGTSLWYIDFRDNTAHEIVTNTRFSGIMVDKDAYDNYYLFTGTNYWTNYMKQIRTIDTTTYTLSEQLNSEEVSSLKEGYFKQIGNYKYSTGGIKDNTSLTAVRIGNIKNGEIDVLGYISYTTGIFETEYGLMYTGTDIELLEEGSSKLKTLASQVNARKLSIVDGKIYAHESSYRKGLYMYNPETQTFARTEYLSLPGVSMLFTKGIYYSTAMIGVENLKVCKYNYSKDAIFSENGKYGVKFSPYSVYVEENPSMN